ncbi:MAG: hypothetical protein M3Y27_02705 [Acidobacteriota bacterium]|nr:hypothetical protein [Acidobacteriota bacterium]
MFSDGRRYTLETELTRRIWKEVERGYYSGPEELIYGGDSHSNGDGF